jgi:hypothetical protein
MSSFIALSADQGSNFEHTFTLKHADGSPFDLSGYDARLQVRRTIGDTTTLINATLANGKLAIGDGSIVFSLIPSDTTSIRFNSKDDDTLSTVFDLEIVSPAGKVDKPTRGSFTLTREVTR